MDGSPMGPRQEHPGATMIQAVLQSRPEDSRWVDRWRLMRPQALPDTFGHNCGRQLLQRLGVKRIADPAIWLKDSMEMDRICSETVANSGIAKLTYLRSGLIINWI